MRRYRSHDAGAIVAHSIAQAAPLRWSCPVQARGDSSGSSIWAVSFLGGTTMLLILVDAMTLIVMLQVVQGEDIGFGTAAIMALVAAIVTGLLAFGLGAAIGLPGVLLAGIIGAIGVGAAVSLMFGVEIKRAMMIGGVFVAVHLAFSVLLSLMMR
jgi:hypothetical protein